MKLSLRWSSALSLVVMTCCAFAQQDIVDEGGLPISASFDNSDVRDVIPKLIDGTASFVLSPAVHGEVKGDYHNMLRKDILAKVLAQVHAKFSEDAGVYLILPQNSKHPLYTAGEDNSQALLTAEFVSAPFRSAVRQLCASECPLIVEPYIDGVVSGSFKGATFEAILQSLCKQIKVSYRISSDIYQIVPRHALDSFEIWMPPSGDPSIQVDVDVVSTQGLLEILMEDAFRGKVYVDPKISANISLHGTFASPLKAVGTVASLTGCDVRLRNGSFIAVKSK